MNSMTSLLAGSIRGFHLETRTGGEIKAEAGSEEHTLSSQDNQDDFPGHVRIHDRLQSLRLLQHVRASQNGKEREKGERSYVIT